VTVASIVADTLVAMYNPQLATWRTSPAANEIERHTLAWLSGKFGLPPHGHRELHERRRRGTISSAVVVALTRAFPSYGPQGLRGLSASPTLYLTGEAHHSFSKIAHNDRARARSGPDDRDGPSAEDGSRDLARRVAADRRNGCAPFMVVGTAGTTGAGAIDPLPELARFCRSENLWFHVDAAWGGAAIISPRLRGHLAGIDAADSITCDAHKWFLGADGRRDVLLPASRGRRRGVSRGDLVHAGQDGGTDSRSVHDIGAMSRRFIGLKLFLALAEHGESGYVEMIDHQARMGDVLRGALQRTGWRVVNTTPLPLVCFTRDGLDTGRFLTAPLSTSDRMDVGRSGSPAATRSSERVSQASARRNQTSSGSCARWKADMNHTRKRCSARVTRVLILLLFSVWAPSPRARPPRRVNGRRCRT